MTPILVQTSDTQGFTVAIDSVVSSREASPRFLSLETIALRLLPAVIAAAGMTQLGPEYAVNRAFGLAEVFVNECRRRQQEIQP